MHLAAMNDQLCLQLQNESLYKQHLLDWIDDNSGMVKSRLSLFFTAPYIAICLHSRVDGCNARRMVSLFVHIYVPQASMPQLDGYCLAYKARQSSSDCGIEACGT